MNLFRNLSEEEAAQFKLWARQNYKPFTPISGAWHPVVQAEAVQMNVEADAAGDIFRGLLPEDDLDPDRFDDSHYMDNPDEDEPDEHAGDDGDPAEYGDN